MRTVLLILALWIPGTSFALSEAEQTAKLREWHKKWSPTIVEFEDLVKKINTGREHGPEVKEFQKKFASAKAELLSLGIDASGKNHEARSQFVKLSDHLIDMCNRGWRALATGGSAGFLRNPIHLNNVRESETRALENLDGKNFGPPKTCDQKEMAAVNWKRTFGSYEVTTVAPGSLWAKAGLKIGDQVTKQEATNWTTTWWVNGKPLEIPCGPPVR